ncbi:hypothetical protein C8R45DRAFT_835939, partial [Mycena sanguinolenta]
MTVFEIGPSSAKTDKKTARKQAERAAKVSPKIPQSDALRRAKAQNSTSVADPSTRFDSAFPPPPASKELQHRILTGMTECFLPSSFEEVGCTICGQL